jgi:hypothetical protein
MRFFKRSAPDKPVGDEPITDEWQVYEGRQNGKRLIASFNTGARQLVGSRNHGIQIGVAVPFHQPDPEGMPGADEMAQLTAFEDALAARAAGRAVLVGVITTGGMREFVLYTGSGDWIEGFHHDLSAALPSHQVQVMAKSDPKWSVYRQFVKK